MDVKDLLKKTRDKLRKPAMIGAIGVSAVTLGSCSTPQKEQAFDAAKDAQAVIVDSQNKMVFFTVSDQVCSMDKDESIKAISENEALGDFVKNDKQRQEVAQIIYENISELNAAAQSEPQTVTTDIHDPFFEGTKGYGYTVSQYQQPPTKSSVSSSLPIMDSSKEYSISVETSTGYKGQNYHFLRDKRINKIREANYVRDQSWGGVYR